MDPFVVAFSGVHGLCGVWSVSRPSQCWFRSTRSSMYNVSAPIQILLVLGTRWQHPYRLSGLTQILRNKSIELTNNLYGITYNGNPAAILISYKLKTGSPRLESG